MSSQKQPSNLAARLGARLSAANEQFKDKPVDTGFQRLPPGIKNGVAKLVSFVIEVYEDDKAWQGAKGMEYARINATVEFSGNEQTPAYHAGVKVRGVQMKTIFIPLCDVPAKGDFPEVTFEANWDKFQNYFKMLLPNLSPCQETKTSDPTGVKTWAYYLNALNTLNNPANPVYFTFSTDSFTPKKSPRNPKPKEILVEKWHARIDWKGIPNTPPGGVNLVSSNGKVNQSSDDTPPTIGADGLPLNSRVTQTNQEDNEPSDLPDEIEKLVDEAYDNENSARLLTELAVNNGWTEEEVKQAESWEDVGDMALSRPAPLKEDTVTVGSKWQFCKRDKNGAKLTNAEGKEFPPQEVEVTTLNEDGTVYVKTTKDNKEVVDSRRKLIKVKKEWLE